MHIIATALTLFIVGVDPGSAVFPLLKIGQGCRAAAMGESFTGLSNDASTIYWNPAGLAGVAGNQFALSHQEWFEGIKDEVGHAALSLGPGALGLGLTYSGEPDVRYWDAEQQRFEEFNAWSAILSAGYGWRLSDKFALGAAATGLYQDLKLEKGYGGALDFGASLWPSSRLGIGFAARHLGMMTFGNGFEERLPMEFALGGSYSTGMFNFTLDAVAPALDNNPNVRAGIEFIPVKPLALRLGYRTGPVSLSSLGYSNGLTGGLGVTVGNFGIDYAFVPYGELGLTHRVGLRLAVPPPTTGYLSIVALDVDTRERLAAGLTVSGVYDTTARTDKLVIMQAWPGDGTLRASLDGYQSATKSLSVVAGRRQQDTIMLKRSTADVFGGIYDARTQQPIGGMLAYSGPSSDEVGVPSTPGTFELKGMAPGSYKLEANGPGDEYFAQEAELELMAGKSAKQDFYLWKKGDLLSLEVNFETGRANILAGYYPMLDLAGTVLKQTPSIKKVELAGHTDPRSIVTPEFREKFKDNWALSQGRADAVKKYLVDKFGIAPERIVAEGYADSRPIASNATPEGMAKNRRTELKVLEYEE